MSKAIGTCWLMIVAFLAGCGEQASSASVPGSEVGAAQIRDLKAQVERLESENAELKRTPAALLADVSAAVAAKDEQKAMSSAKRLAEKFPSSIEATQAASQVNDLIAENKRKAEDAARLAALGFKAVKVSATFPGDQAVVALKSAGTSRRWIFDAYSDEWHYQEPEKGHTFVTAKVTVSSKSKDPGLPGLALYIADGNTLKRLGLFEYRFARWDDFGSYLGNYADYRNDFAHSTSIPFSLATEIDAVDAIKKPLYIVVTKEGCHERGSPASTPPVSYYSNGCSTLKASLTVADFSAGQLGILKRID